MHREREQAAQKSLATQNRIATLVLSRSPFSASDLEALEKAAATCEYEILITPVARRSRSCYRTSSRRRCARFNRCPGSQPCTR
jgi:hypothetical protein